MESGTHAEPSAASGLFEGFEARDVPTTRGTVHAMVGGSGSPLLLLHGYPQSHLMWHAAAPLLAQRHTVVAADLAGYGASFRPAPAPDHVPHSKRALALDQVQAMAALGFDRFAVAGTTAADGSPTGLRSTIPTASSGLPCSTSSRRARCGRAPNGPSRGATGTGRSSPCPRRCPSASSAATPRRSSISTCKPAWAWAWGRPRAVSRRGPGRLPARARRPGHGRGDVRGLPRRRDRGRRARRRRPRG